MQNYPGQPGRRSRRRSSGGIGGALKTVSHSAPARPPAHAQLVQRRAQGRAKHAVTQQVRAQTPRRSLYQQAARHSPPNQKAQARAGASFRFLRALVGSRGSQTGDAALRNPLWDRGAFSMYAAPGTVDRANYSDLYHRLWQKEGGWYHGKEPRLQFESQGSNAAAGGQNTLGWVSFDEPRGKRTVHVTPAGLFSAHLRPRIRQMTERDASGHDAGNLARAVPLHEWVHAFQANRKLRGKNQIEGGAEALSQAIAPDAGLPYRRPARDPYEQYRRRAVSKGIDFILQRQFGR